MSDKLSNEEWFQFYTTGFKVGERYPIKDREYAIGLFGNAHITEIKLINLEKRLSIVCALVDIYIGESAVSTQYLMFSSFRILVGPSLDEDTVRQ